NHTRTARTFAEVDLTCATRKLVASGGGDCAETAMRDKLARAAVTANPRMLLQASRTLKRDGRAGLWPTRPSTPGLPSARIATHPTFNAPDNTLLAHRPRQHATWLMLPAPPC